MSSADLILALLFFSRASGFFLISPLFAKKNIPVGLRFGFAALCTFVLTPPLSIAFQMQFDSSLILIECIKELLIGYLLGFLFALIFEAAALAGQVVGTMAGFSIAEILDPQETQKTPLFSRLFTLTLFTLFLLFDLHHFLLRFLFETFRITPPLSATLAISESSALLFQQALSYALIPIFFLGLVLITFAILSRALYQFPIFFIGFPLQLLIGIIATSLALSFFSDILQKAFFEFLTLAKRLLFPL